MVEPLSASVAAGIGAGESLIAMSEKLGILERLRRKLMKQPDVASSKLEMTLFELSKVYGILDNTVNEYMSLWLVPDEGNAKRRQELTKLRQFASGRHETEMRKAKGDCQKMWSIYVAYLQPWFDRTLNPREAQELGSLFRELSDIDSVMIDAIEGTSTWLTHEALATMDLVQQQEYEAAQTRVEHAWHEWLPAAKTLRESMNRLYDLRAAFIADSAAV